MHGVARATWGVAMIENRVPHFVINKEIKKKFVKNHIRKDNIIILGKL